MKFIFDIEADGLLDELTTIHCLVLKNTQSGEVHQFYESSVKEGVELLLSAELVVGHNILCFDLPAIKKVYGVELPNAFDTLVASRLIYTNLMELDVIKQKAPRSLWGKHSLEAWGHRLGEYKSQPPTDWSKFSLSMLKYCEQDVHVTHKLYDTIVSKNYSTRALELEHEFRKIIFQQEQNGVPFDTTKAMELAEQVEKEIISIKEELRTYLPLQIKRGGVFVPKRDNSKMGYQKGKALSKIAFSNPNPGSREQVVSYFKSKYGWKPDVLTDKGNPKLDDEVLREMPYSEAERFADLFERIKIQGYLTTGKNAWTKLVRMGRIHGQVNTNGAVTGRCTHSYPNLSQVPSVRKYLGKECRALFHSGLGWMIGADAAGLELRMLAHYLYPYDGGRYAKTILEGDIHTSNQQAAGIETRDDAKTFIYAFCYGAGIGKLGSIVTKSKDVNLNKEVGKTLKENFLKKVEGLRELIDRVQFAAKKGYLIGLDGRHLHIRSDHKALNTLLQGAGAVVMKQANVNFWKNPFPETYQVLTVHDEFEMITNREDLTEEIGKSMVASIAKAGVDFNLNIRLDGEYKIGRNWSEVH